MDNSKILGIAGQFNIFTRNLNSTSDLNGNFASENLNIQGWLNVGTTGISYIKNALTSNHDGLSFKSNTLILGEYLKYTKNILWGRPGIGNFSLSTAPSNFKQDVDGKKYIDFDSEFERLSNNSKRIANASTAVPISYSYDAGTIDVSNAKSQNNVKYVTVNFSDIHENAKLDVVGNTDNAKIVITIDCSEVNKLDYFYSVT
ncbi:collagen-binding domain-containing protein [Leuconostoc mesenteroides]|uniref:collagen-binding domain-containing protein n=1 Tax=Leuconostoc mesenteroides TaxID=1245 RepID=UPI002362CB1B|nr:collagen-binding domain-containing protein [Leuconostoc mesenteroides]